MLCEVMDNRAVVRRWVPNMGLFDRKTLETTIISTDENICDLAEVCHVPIRSWES